MTAMMATGALLTAGSAHAGWDCATEKWIIGDYSICTRICWSSAPSYCMTGEWPDPLPFFGLPSGPPAPPPLSSNDRAQVQASPQRAICEQAAGALYPVRLRRIAAMPGTGAVTLLAQTSIDSRPLLMPDPGPPMLNQPMPVVESWREAISALAQDLPVLVCVAEDGATLKGLEVIPAAPAPAAPASSQIAPSKAVRTP